jgi:MOSC domain-containing protein YiiM
MRYATPVEIRHIFVSPGHNYFGKPKDGPGEHPTYDLDQVEVRAGRGIVGDRYYGVPAHYEAQITFIAWETLQALFEEFQLEDASPILARRNVVISGANLNQLIGQEFALDFGGGDDSGSGVVRFLGTKPCSPCGWMDAMFAPGAHEFLRGRGGLRARILSDGVLRKGAATLRTDIWIDVARAAAALAKPRLP